MSRPRPQPVLQASLAILLGLVCLLAGWPTSTAAAAVSPSGLHVVGNRLVDASGTTVVLRGVNRSGSEYACIQGFGFFEGPSDDASIAAMASWKINTVRVPLNEDCWLGINNAPAAYSGSAYRSQMTAYVNRLHAAGLIAVLDLHWTAAGGNQSNGQTQMADADHAPAFWTSVATTFRSNSAVVFDLFNEPHDISWVCWRDGGECGVGYQVAGMQNLLSAVRATGATNPVLAGGLRYANDLSSWLAFKPNDPTGNLLASWHSYNFNACVTASCWDREIAPVAAAVPLVTGEIGENDCAHGYIDGLMTWLDGHATGYLGWGWDTFDCSSFPALISNYNGTPTNFGVGLRDHLVALAGSTPSPTPTVTATATPVPTRTPSPSPTPSPTATPSPTPTRSTTLSPTPTPTGTAGGGIAVAGTANTSSAPWWWEEDLDLTPSGTVTALTLTVTVARTPGISYSGQWSNGPGGALALTNATSATAVTYTAKLNNGASLPAGSVVRIASQFGGSGAAHPVSGDTYTLTATVGGTQFTRSGHF